MDSKPDQGLNILAMYAEELSCFADFMVSATIFDHTPQKSAVVVMDSVLGLGTATSDDCIAVAVAYPAHWTHDDVTCEHQHGITGFSHGELRQDVIDAAIEMACEAWRDVADGEMKPVELFR